MAKYRYKTKSSSDLIVYLLDGERINLVGGSVEITLPSTKSSPPRKVIVREATDADFEKILSNPKKYGNWSKKIERIELKISEIEKTDNTKKEVKSLRKKRQPRDTDKSKLEKVDIKELEEPQINQ